MSSVKGDLSQNQDEHAAPQLAEVYSYAAPILQPLNVELAAAAIKVHIDSRAAMLPSLSQNRAFAAPCLLFSLLESKPFATTPIAPVGVSHLQGSPGCGFALRDAHPRLSQFIQTRLNWLNTTYEAKANQQLASPRDAILDLWTKACENDPSRQLQGMQPRLILRTTDPDLRDLATMFYRLIFGDKAASQLQISEAAGVQPVAGPGEVSLEFIWQPHSLTPSEGIKQFFELGSIWQQITALPFVMTIWQKGPMPAPGLAERLHKAAQLAETKMKIEPSAYFTGKQSSSASPKQLSALWQRTRYLLSEDDFLGLQLLGQIVQLSRRRSDHDFYLRSSKWNAKLAGQQNPLPS